MLHGRPVVLLDCDDVVCQCAQGMADVAAAKIGTPVSIDSLKTWDFFDNVSHPDHPDLKEHVEAAMSSKGWCADLTPFPGAVEGVLRLKTIAEVFFVTAPWKGEHWPHERRQWLENHFQMEHWRILQTSTKFLVRGDLFIDDKVEHCTQWQEFMPGGMAAIWDRPHNRGHDGIQRFFNWDQVYGWVEDLIDLQLRVGRLVEGARR